eukprot:g20079.t1
MQQCPKPRTQWVTFRVTCSPRQCHSSRTPPDAVGHFKTLQAARHPKKDKSLLPRQIFLLKGAYTFLVNLEKKVTLNFMCKVLEQASDQYFTYSVHEPVETAWTGEKFAPGEREAENRCEATIEREAATTAAGLLSAEFVLVDASHKATYRYDGAAAKLIRTWRETRSAHGDAGAAADMAQLRHNRVPDLCMRISDDCQAIVGNSSRPGLERSVALRIMSTAEVHQPIRSEPACASQAKAMHGNGVDMSGLATQPRALDVFQRGQELGANGNGAEVEPSWGCHQPEQLQTPSPPGSMLCRSTRSSCDMDDGFSFTSRSASSFGVEGDYHKEEENVQPAPPRDGTGVENVDEDSPSAWGVGVGGNTVATSGAVGLKQAAWTALAVSRMQQMQREKPVFFRESLEKFIAWWRSSSKSLYEATSMASNRGLDEHGGSGGGGGGEFIREPSHEKVLSALRQAKESGEVAGATELDDEDMAELSSLLLDGPGSPSTVADDATAEEVNRLANRPPQHPQQDPKNLEPIWESTLLERTPLEFGEPILLDVFVEGGFHPTAKTSPSEAGLMFGKGRRMRAYMARKAKRFRINVPRSLSSNALTTLPAGIFEGLTSLKTLLLNDNDLTTLPAGLFEGLANMTELLLSENALNTLPAGIFESLAALESLRLHDNALTTLPAGLFQGLVNMTTLNHGACTCNHGARRNERRGTPPAPTPASDSTPIVAGVVSAVAGAALIAIGVFLKRRRASKQKTGSPPSHDGDNLEQGHDPPGLAATSAAPAVGVEGGILQDSHRRNSSLYSDTPGHAHGNDDGDRDEEPPAYQDVASSHRHTPAEADVNDGGGIKTRSAPAPEEDAAGVSAKMSSETTSSFATVSTASMSTAEQEEVAQFRQRQADAAPVANGPTKEALVGDTAASSSASRRGSNGDIGLGQAVLAAAQELARSCQIPGVSEAAGVLCVMANLFTDSRDIDQASKSRLRQCRSIVLALTRADKVVAKVSRNVRDLW